MIILVLVQTHHFIAQLATKNKIGFEEIKEAMIYGTLTASFCVESFGVEGLRKLDKETLNNRLEIFKSYLT